MNILAIDAGDSRSPRQAVRERRPAAVIEPGIAVDEAEERFAGFDAAARATVPLAAGPA